MRYEHILAEFLETPWAILPEKLQTICALVAMRVDGERLTPAEIQARVGGRESAREVKRSGGVAVLPVYGVISNRMNMLSDMSGGTSIEKLTAQFRDALADPQISSILLDIDSPGGAVSGVPELASEIYAARGKKRIVAQVNPLSASAGYWLAAPAHEIAVTPSGSVGSIGVYATHQDVSRMLEAKGIKISQISAGKYKTEGTEIAPLSDEARAYMQQRVDEFYGMFVDAVARGRGVTAAAVRYGFGEGRVVGAQQAVALGMADRVATFDQTVEGLLGGKPGATSVRAESSVSVPAAQAADNPATAENQHEEVAPMATSAVTPAAAAADTAIAAHEARFNSIISLCNRAGMPEKAAAWIREGKTVDQVSAEIVDLMAKRNTPHTPPPPDPGAQVHLTENESKRYSIMRAIRGLCARQGQKGRIGADDDAGFEFEISDSIAKKLGKDTAGILIPTNLANVDEGSLSDGARDNIRRMRAARFGADMQATLTGGGSPGSSLVQTTIMPTEFIELLRNMQVVMKLGARRMGDLQGNIALPKQTGAATLYWTGENPGSAVTETDQNFAQVLGSPKQAMAQTAFSRMFLIQSSLDAEQLIREDLALIFALGIDLAALVGTGTSNQPKGIANQSGVNVEACGVNGGAITYSILTQMQADIEVANVPLVNTGWATTPGVKKKLRNTAELSNTISLPIWHSDDTIAGWDAMSSNQLPSNGSKGTTNGGLHTAIAGCWNQLVIPEWGALEIIADPFTQAGKGNVVLTGSMLVDILVRYAQAFTVCSDIDPTQ